MAGELTQVNMADAIVAETVTGEFAAKAHETSQVGCGWQDPMLRMETAFQFDRSVA